MDILILIRNILVPVAIGMWVLIGLVALFIFLKNKLGGKIKPTSGNAYKQTFVQGYNANDNNNSDSALGAQQKADKAVQEALNATKALNKESNNNNTNKTNLCL